MRGPVVLVGLMGSGKTSVGRHLAEALGWEWADLDRALEARWKASVREQFRRHGEAEFRRRETLELKRLMGKAGRVLSTGGGVVLAKSNRTLLKGAVTVYLQASPLALAARLRGSQARKRPLLGAEPLKALQTLSRLRQAHYQDVALFTVRASQGGPEQVAWRIVRRLKELS